jgi:hypothetical protein
MVESLHKLSILCAGVRKHLAVSIETLRQLFRYEVEFSKPHATKPIPEGTVKVFFNIIQLQSENGDDNGYEVEFNFENESLKHKLNNSMRKNMFEVSNHFTVLTIS